MVSHSVQEEYADMYDRREAQHRRLGQTLEPSPRQHCLAASRKKLWLLALKPGSNAKVFLRDRGQLRLQAICPATWIACGRMVVRMSVALFASLSSNATPTANIRSYFGTKVRFDPASLAAKPRNG